MPFPPLEGAQLPRWVNDSSNFKSEQEPQVKPSSGCFPNITEAICQLSEVLGAGQTRILCRQVLKGEFSHVQGLRDWSISPLWDGQCLIGPPFLGGQLAWYMCVLWWGSHTSQISTFPKGGTDPLFLPTQENFPGISNYLQSHVDIYHIDAIWSFTEGIWQNHTLLKKSKKYSIFPLPKGSQKLHLFFQDTHTRDVKSDPERFLIKGIQDNGNFQHDWNCNCRNDCSATQKLFNCLGWSLPLLPVILLLLLGFGFFI